MWTDGQDPVEDRLHLFVNSHRGPFRYEGEETMICLACGQRCEGAEDEPRTD
jgi:hypothetical protein